MPGLSLLLGAFGWIKGTASFCLDAVGRYAWLRWTLAGVAGLLLVAHLTHGAYDKGLAAGRTECQLASQKAAAEQKAHDKSAGDAVVSAADARALQAKHDADARVRAADRAVEAARRQPNALQACLTKETTDAIRAIPVPGAQ
jgi:hypothetical protein